MILKNNTNGKPVTLSKEAYESMSVIAKAGYTVVNEQDTDSIDQVVKNTSETKKSSAPAAESIVKKTQPSKTAPDSGSKKDSDKK